jgi:hypothetical protein
MRGQVVVTSGHQGWGNRKSGCEAYGPGGRWAGPIELPNRSNANVAHGDLLGDHLDELGCHEGSPFIVIAATSRFDVDEFDALRERIERFLAVDEHTRLWADEIRGDA